MTINGKDEIGTVLAEDMYAARSLPPFPASIMDGYAVSSVVLFQCYRFDLKSFPFSFLKQDSSESRRVIGMLSAGGRTGDNEVQAGTAFKIMTGAPIPHGADAVIMVSLLLPILLLIVSHIHHFRLKIQS